MNEKFSPETSLRISKENPEAAGNFLKYMHSVEPQVLEAQKAFAKAINDAMQDAAKAFVEGEGLQLSEADADAMAKNCQAICKSMCINGDEMIKKQFAEMSENMIVAAKKQLNA